MQKTELSQLLSYLQLAFILTILWDPKVAPRHANKIITAGLVGLPRAGSPVQTTKLSPSPASGQGGEGRQQGEELDRYPLPPSPRPLSELPLHLLLLLVQHSPQSMHQPGRSFLCPPRARARHAPVLASTAAGPCPPPYPPRLARDARRWLLSTGLSSKQRSVCLTLATLVNKRGKSQDSL